MDMEKMIQITRKMIMKWKLTGVAGLLRNGTARESLLALKTA